MKADKEEGFTRGEQWTSKYLYHIPLRRASRRKKPAVEETEGSEGEDPEEPQRTQKF